MCKPENPSNETESIIEESIAAKNGTNATELVTTCEEEEFLHVATELGVCYLHSLETMEEQIRSACEVAIVIMALLYIIKAVREFKFLGRKVFFQNMVLCPSRVCFLLSCVLLQFCIPARFLCLYHMEDALAQIAMLCNGLYFLFFCRGFKLVGPMVIMIYRMLAQDLMRFGIIYSIFIMGFGQAYYLIFMSYNVSFTALFMTSIYKKSTFDFLVI